MKPRPAVARAQVTREEFECAVVDRKAGAVKIRYRSILDTIEEAWISESQIVRYRDEPSGDKSK